MFYKFDEELLQTIHVIFIVVSNLYSLVHSVKPFTTKGTLDDLPTKILAEANTRYNVHTGILSKLPHYLHNVVITVRGQKILLCRVNYCGLLLRIYCYDFFKK